MNILAPFTGRVVPIDEVPDPVFSQRMLGDGAAIEPEEGVAVAPIGGALAVFHSAGHAFAILGEDGTQVLVHIGLDTVKMGGQGFVRLAQAGQRVERGQEIVRFDLEAIRAAGYATLSPIVLPELPPHKSAKITRAERVTAGQDVLLEICEIN